MIEVTLRFTNANARYITCFLRDRYHANKRTKLAKLCKIAVLTEVQLQALKDLQEAEKALAEE